MLKIFKLDLVPASLEDSLITWTPQYFSEDFSRLRCEPNCSAVMEGSQGFSECLHAEKWRSLLVLQQLEMLMDWGMKAL